VGRGRGETSYFQEGKGEKMRPCESLMNSKVSSYQRGELIEEDQKSILMIGRIEVFLPHRPAKEKNCVTDVATIEGQPVVTVREKGDPEKTSKSTPAEEEHANKMLTPWEMELEMLEDWLNHPELEDECHEKTVIEISRKENSEKLLKNFSQGSEQLMMSAVLRHAAEDEGEL
jgi:hypothetical protein